MAIINCPECNSGVSDTAQNCPHCGFKMPSKNMGCMAWVGFGVVAFIAFLILGKSPDGDEYYEQNAALDACISQIKSNLKNPQSADFDTANARVTSPKPDFKTIFITVRATNTYNAFVPADYACFIRKNKGIWTVDDIQETAQ